MLTAILACESLSADLLAAGLDGGQGWAFEAVRQVAGESGLAVYLVGGPVRDALLGWPLLDLDFAVEGDAPGLARRVAERLTGGCSRDVRVTAHARFGTATVAFDSCAEDGERDRGRIDLVTARRESYPRPGQLPCVTPGSIGDDLARRDFSINAMALPLTATGEGAEGGLLDPLGGLDDLRAGIVRVLHRRSFVDDPTRLLRAVRYEQRFGFRIERATLSAMAGAVAKGCMDAVSGDRWRHELERILDEANPVAPLQRAAELGVLAGLHPSLGKHGAGLRGLVALSCDRELKGERVGPDECLAALFSPLSAVEGEGVIRRLRLSGRRAALSRDTIELRESEPQIRACAGTPSELARMLAGRELAAVSAWAALTADPLVAAALRRYAGELRLVKPELSGAALLDMGVREGPLVGEILARLRDARLDGAVNSRDEETALARALLGRARAAPIPQG